MALESRGAPRLDQIRAMPFASSFDQTHDNHTLSKLEPITQAKGLNVLSTFCEGAFSQYGF